VADKLSSDYPPNQRRQFLQYFASVGLSSSLLPGVLWAKLHEPRNCPRKVLNFGYVFPCWPITNLESSASAHSS